MITNGLLLAFWPLQFLRFYDFWNRGDYVGRAASWRKKVGKVEYRLLGLEHFHTWCIGWSTASAVQLGFGNETALATEVTETLPQALKRDPRIDGSYARLKACSAHPLYARCETAVGSFVVGVVMLWDVLHIGA